MRILDKDYTLVTLDAETYYGPKYSLSLQDMNTFKYVADEQFLIHGIGVKIDDQATEYFDFHVDSDVTRFRHILDYLRTKNTALLCHNTAFDGFILHYHFGWCPDLYLDTVGMSRAMFVGQSASLSELAKRLWPEDARMSKLDDLAKTYGLRVLPPEIATALATYCIRDVDLCYEAFKLLLDHFPDDELRLIDMTLRMMCEPMFEVDVGLVQEEIDYQVKTREAAIRLAREEHGVTEAKLKSDKKFAEFLISKGVEIETKRNAKDTDDIPALGKQDWGYLNMIAAHPELSSVWVARRLAKSNIQESRARWFKAVAGWNNNKMPVPLNYYGADTGRWSGGEKLNLQNLPRNNNKDEITDPNSGRLRRALLAPRGSKVIVRDLNNIEGRVLAWVAGEEHLLDLFRNDGCPYLALAEKIYEAPAGSFTKDTHGFERNVGKVAQLGLGYGMGANKFWVTLNTGPMGMAPIPTSFDEAQNIVNVFRSTNANISRYWSACSSYIEAMASLDYGDSLTFGPIEIMRNMAVLPNGLALQYPNLHGEPNQYGGYDFTFGNNKKIYGGLFTENIVQALARIVLSEQMLTIQRELDSNYGRDVARIVLSVHDEAIVIAPDQYAQEVYDFMGDVMSTPPTWAKDLPLKSEGGFAQEYSK